MTPGRSIRYLIIPAFLSIIFPGVLFSQQLSPPTIKIIPSITQPGGKVDLIITIPLKPNLHIYGPNVDKPYFATKVEMQKKGPIIWSNPILPEISTLNFMGEHLKVIEIGRAHV